MNPISLKQARELGLARYFTGKPCPHGHLSERWVIGNHCIDCSRDTSVRYRKNHPDRAVAQTRAYKKAHPEWKKETDRKYYHSNKAKHRVWQKRYDDKHPEVGRESARRYRAAHPEKMRAIAHTRRSREVGAEGKCSAADLRRIKKEQGNKCAYCGVSFRNSKAHVDHIIPLSRGGTNYPRNIQILCNRCNLRKSYKDPIVFAQELGRLL